MAVVINGESPYLNGRCPLETLTGLRVVVSMLDGSELAGKLAGYWPSGFDLDSGGRVPRYVYFKQVASVRGAEE